MGAFREWLGELLEDPESAEEFHREMKRILEERRKKKKTPVGVGGTDRGSG